MVPGLRGRCLTLVVALGAGMSASTFAQPVPITAQPSGAHSSDTSASARADAPDRAAPSSPLRSAQGLLMLDYQVIPVKAEPSLDLMGFHVMQALTDDVYLGVGGFAPLLKGEYGGFMAFDVSAHAQRRVWDRLFVDAGVAIGGGGGGRSIQHSKLLSGTGGFAKGYAGLGYDFDELRVGANVARMKFKGSAIDHTQLNLFVQVPFSYTVGSFASVGQPVSAADAQGFAEAGSQNTLTWGMDNYVQIDPVGANTSTIRVADLQFAHYLTRSTYWFASLGVGYRGLPLYNQVIGGLGHRTRLAPRVSLLAQLGLGSGGYAPETIDTGAGLLVYPKLAAEYALTRHLGLAVTAGYLHAARGSSRNYTFGASLAYHVRPEQGPADTALASTVARYGGYRFSLFQQSEYNVRYRDIDRARLSLLSVQLDGLLTEHLYLPIQAAVAYNAYLGYPGYGELLVGLGVQTRHRPDERLQLFAQLLGGTNVHGAIAKPGVGLDFAVSDRLAVRALAGTTLSLSASDRKFKADYLGLGLTYRFSLPNG